MLKFSTSTPQGSKAIRLRLTYTHPDKSLPEEIHEFNISTYRKLTKENDNIQSTCDLVNAFLGTYSEEMQREFFLYCAEMLADLKALSVGTLNMTIQKMSDRTTEICKWMEIPKRSVEFVKAINIPLPPDLAKGPQRIQDTAEKTFDREEYYLLTGISLLCKVLSPVLGECVDRMQPPVADKSNKELFAFMLVLPILENDYFANVFAKLSDYIENTTTKAIEDLNSRLGGNEPSIMFTLAKNGVDEVRFKELVHAMIYVKKLVTFDVWNSGTSSSREPNIMTYIYVSVFETARSKLNTIKHQSNVLARFDQADTGGSTQDNATHLEHVARVSKITADIPIMAELGMLILIPQILKKYDIPQAHFDAAERFYTKNFIKPSAFSRALMASFVGRYIGGSSMLLYLTRPLYTKLVIVTQLFLAKFGYDQLALMISASTPDQIRSGPLPGAAFRVLENYYKSAEYLECLRLFPGFSEKAHHKSDPTGRNSSGEDYISIENQCKRMVNWIVEYDHYYTVPVIVWNLLGVEDRPETGSLISYKETIMDQFCKFLITVHSPELTPIMPL